MMLLGRLHCEAQAGQPEGQRSHQSPMYGPMHGVVLSCTSPFCSNKRCAQALARASKMRCLSNRNRSRKAALEAESVIHKVNSLLFGTSDEGLNPCEVSDDLAEA